MGVLLFVLHSIFRQYLNLQKITLYDLNCSIYDHPVHLIPILKVLGAQDAKIMKFLPLIILELSIISQNTAIKCFECFDSIRNTQKIVVSPPCD